MERGEDGLETGRKDAEMGTATMTRRVDDGRVTGCCGSGDHDGRIATDDSNNKNNITAHTHICVLW